MPVSAVLKRKGCTVVTISPTETVEEAAVLLTRHRIGAVLVIDDLGHPAGILSERDIIRAIATGGKAVTARRVSELMTRKLITCAPADTISEIMAMMSAHRIRHLPVLENGALVGMVSIGDAVKARLDDADLEVDNMRTLVTAVR